MVFGPEHKFYCDVNKSSRSLRSVDSEGQIVVPRFQAKPGEASFSSYAAHK